MLMYGKIPRVAASPDLENNVNIPYKKRLSLIVPVNIVLNRTVVVDSD